jgi:hypothetical protein
VSRPRKAVRKPLSEGRRDETETGIVAQLIPPVLFGSPQPVVTRPSKHVEHLSISHKPLSGYSGVELTLARPAVWTVTKTTMKFGEPDEEVLRISSPPLRDRTTTKGQ